jgi:predicted CopG family antitoxin
MTTISVTENVKRALLKIASELQSKLGIRIDLNEAIRYLLKRGKKDPNLLEEVCRPIPEFELAYKELIEERRRDEKRVRKKYGV